MIKSDIDFSLNICSESLIRVIHLFRFVMVYLINYWQWGNTNANISFSKQDHKIPWYGKLCIVQRYWIYIFKHCSKILLYHGSSSWPWNSLCKFSFLQLKHDGRISLNMLCTAQLGGPVLKASGRVQYIPFQLGDKSPMITDQHTAGDAVSQLSQLAKLSPWLTLSTKDITTSFWQYNKWFWFLSNQVMCLYHLSNPIE